MCSLRTLGFLTCKASFLKIWSLAFPSSFLMWMQMPEKNTSAKRKSLHRLAEQLLLFKRNRKAARSIQKCISQPSTWAYGKAFWENSWFAVQHVLPLSSFDARGRGQWFPSWKPRHCQKEGLNPSTERTARNYSSSKLPEELPAWSFPTTT